MQIQTDKEKLLYELDNLQRELEKAQVNTTRFQHEKEDFEVDAGRQREKNEKLQVSWDKDMLNRPDSLFLRTHIKGRFISFRSLRQTYSMISCSQY